MSRSIRMFGVLCVGLGSVVAFGDVFDTYEDLPEGFLGASFAHGGVNYVAVNDVSGQFPDGSTFQPSDLGDQFTVENATVFYNDFPGYGSPVKSLTFGGAFVPGPNLSIGALASARMTLDEPGSSAELDIAYYENGPWGGIVYHLDALLGNAVVASDSFTISGFGGRDNPTFSTLSVAAPAFDGLHLYATFGDNYSAPRGMIDNLSITSVPEPATMALLAAISLGVLRRR